MYSTCIYVHVQLLNMGSKSPGKSLDTHPLLPPTSYGHLWSTHTYIVHVPSCPSICGWHSNWDVHGLSMDTHLYPHIYVPSCPSICGWHSNCRINKQRVKDDHHELDICTGNGLVAFHSDMECTHIFASDVVPMVYTVHTSLRPHVLLNPIQIF